jgi:signal transduction histidine kinase
MKNLSDKQLLSELKIRVEERQQAIQKLEQLNNELYRANTKLMESEQLKTNFLSNARNEIINPLSSILSFSQAIAFSDQDDPVEIKKMAAIIYKEAFELDFQMKNIFSSAEIEAGEAWCEYYQIDLSDLVEKQMSKFKNFALDKEMTLVLENRLDSDSGLIKSDPAKIQIIISNLIVNAINWSERTGKIKIGLSKQKDKIRISIADRGPGISKEDQKIIFDRFKSLDPKVHTGNKGHGLGLSVSKAYAELLGGDILLQSQPGKGSVFTLVFPVAPADQKTMGSSDNGQDFIFDNDTELF